MIATCAPSFGALVNDLVKSGAVTYRAVDYWIRTGRVKLAHRPLGSGHYRTITPPEERALRRFVAEYNARICAGCSNQASCLDAELAMMRAGYVTAGVVGGTTPGQRRALLTHAELSRRPPYELEPCGTLAGYARHHRDGEEPCASCKREHARAAADRKRARRERAGQLVLFPPIDWSVMGPLRRAALAESWRLRNTSGSTASAGLVEPRRFERVPAREARSA